MNLIEYTQKMIKSIDEAKEFYFKFGELEGTVTSPETLKVFKEIFKNSLKDLIKSKINEN